MTPELVVLITALVIFAIGVFVGRTTCEHEDDIKGRETAAAKNGLLVSNEESGPILLEILKDHPRAAEYKAARDRDLTKFEKTYP